MINIRCEGCMYYPLQPHELTIYIRGRNTIFYCPKCNFKNEDRYEEIIIGK